MTRRGERENIVKARIGSFGHSGQRPRRKEIGKWESALHKGRTNEFLRVDQGIA